MTPKKSLWNPANSFLWKRHRYRWLLSDTHSPFSLWRNPCHGILYLLMYPNHSECSTHTRRNHESWWDKQLLSYNHLISCTPIIQPKAWISLRPSIWNPGVTQALNLWLFCSPQGSELQITDDQYYPPNPRNHSENRNTLDTWDLTGWRENQTSGAGRDREDKTLWHHKTLGLIICPHVTSTWDDNGRSEDGVWTSSEDGPQLGQASRNLMRSHPTRKSDTLRKWKERKKAAKATCPPAPTHHTPPHD